MSLPKPHYERGNVRLWNADCMEILPLIPKGSVELAWFDPPYGHGNADDDFLARRHEIMRDENASPQTAIVNDQPETMRAVLDSVFDELSTILDDCCCCCCCCGGGGPSPTFAWVANRMDTRGLSFFHSVIWDKKNPGIGWRYRRQHEMVMIGHRKGGRLRWADDAVKSPNIVSLSKPRDANHPNEKPVELPELFIGLHSIVGDTVLDPFMGSGTTGVACVKTGRAFMGIEIEPKYFDIACKRIDKAFDDFGLLEHTPPAIRQPVLFEGDE